MGAFETDFEFDTGLLAELTETSGVPGYEDRIREIVRRELSATTDTVRSDAMGNVIGTLDGTSDYSVVVATHMDEIGFMVRHITDDGFLTIDALGGWDPRVLRAQRVTVHTDDGDLPGVIGSTPPHTDDDSDEQSIEDVYVDVGLDAETVETRVSVGDLITMDQSTQQVGDHITGKAIDNRVSVCAMVTAARQLTAPDVTIHFAATVQEEVGLRGASALGVDLDPDLAIALDTTVANDIPSHQAKEHVTELGEGTGIKLKDSGVITNPKVHSRLQSVAEQAEIPYQMEILPRGRTDTAGFQTTHGATPVGAISVPTRYLHTVTESVHHADLTATIDLLTAFLESETGEHDYRL
ncbi:M42 family metallopeptidase [Halocatena salina]|uniref:M42 family metallopeptidase n=1 Tax=Halocatena salina TaxID=2934340 RepID=A0A8U0A3I1_9EURY|nr:M42 family metallopeptidase [Halocatena salina]UPM43755.1 M42 family metallopeptidase [Halocatena salina]